MEESLWGFGGSTSLGVDVENTPRPLSDSKALGFSLVGGNHGTSGPWLALLHPSLDRHSPHSQTDTPQTAHQFLGNLSHGKKNPSPE